MITKKEIKKYVDYIGRKTLQNSNEHANFNALYSKVVTLGIMNLADKITAQRQAKEDYNKFSDEEKHSFWTMYHSLVF